MNNINTELIKQAYKLFGVSNPFDFQRAYTSYEQIFFKSGQWSAYNTELLFNKARVILECMDFSKLNETESLWFTEVLWFWYHHAISFERYRSVAQQYADKALELQGEDHPNRITRLLWYLTHDDLVGARKWIDTDVAGWCPDDRLVAIEVVDEYNPSRWV